MTESKDLTWARAKLAALVRRLALMAARGLYL